MAIPISIITVCYNAEKEIAETLESVKNQSYQNFQYIVIDGKSTDQTLSILQSYSQTVKFALVSEKDQGIYDAMNKGVSLAEGELVYFLNAGDVFLHRDVLKNIAEFYAKNPVDVLHGISVSVDKNGITKLIKHENADILSLFRKTINHQAVFAKRSLLLENKKFDTTFKIYADYDWMLRTFLKEEVKTAYVPIGIALYRRGGFSDQHYESIGKKEFVEVRKKNFQGTKFLLMRILYNRYLNLPMKFLLERKAFRRKIHEILSSQ